jgi:5-methylcytosine-specific restriction endonuclease McrA
MTREGDFSQRIKQQARERANWTCELPGCDESAIEVDHKKPLWQGGDNSLGNAQVLCKKHHAAKTKREAPMRAKADRQAGRKGQYARRQKAKANGTYRPIQSRGFNKTYRKKMSGEVVKT